MAYAISLLLRKGISAIDWHSGLRGKKFLNHVLLTGDCHEIQLAPREIRSGWHHTFCRKLRPILDSILDLAGPTGDLGDRDFTVDNLGLPIASRLPSLSLFGFYATIPPESPALLSLHDHPRGTINLNSYLPIRSPRFSNSHGARTYGGFNNGYRLSAGC